MTQGIRCLGYAGQKYYLIGEVTPEVLSFKANELLRQPALCELRAATDWKAEAKDGKVDWAEEGSRLLVACQKAGRFHVEEREPKPKRRLNGSALIAGAQPFDGWLEQLQRTDRGIKGNDYNVTVALSLCPELAGKIGWDVRRLAYVAAQDTPAGPAGPWTDSHTARLAVWLQSHDIPVTTRHVDTALAAAGRANQFDPLGDYLNGVVWDGQERIGTWLTDYCQAESSDANSIMGSKFLIGAVARALRPGCQMDTMLVFEGDQGRRKSSAIRILGGEYTSENLPDFHSKDAQQIIGCKWIIEVSELAAIGKSQLEAIKAFITRREDTFRPPYGRHPITAPRWSVMIGNYNPDGVGILQDSTGGRRFWIAGVGMIDTDALSRDRDQLWAEAVYCFRRGDAWWPDQRENEPIETEQEARQDTDDWLPVVDHWIATDSQTGDDLPTPRSGFTTGDVATQCLGFVSRDITRSDQMRIAKCLKQLGYKRVKKWGKYASRNIFVRS